jgi:hypothetical protein
MATDNRSRALLWRVLKESAAGALASGRAAIVAPFRLGQPSAREWGVSLTYRHRV